MTDQAKNIVDPERMKRVVDQTVQRLRTDKNFLGCVQQTMTAALGGDPKLAAMNVALILAQVEQLAREAVRAKLEVEFEKNVYEPTDAELGDDDEPSDTWSVGFGSGFAEAECVVQKLCDDFGAVRVLRATQQPPTNDELRGMKS